MVCQSLIRGRSLSMCGWLSVLPLALILGCSDDKGTGSGDEGGPHDLPGGVTETVVDNDGASLLTQSGILLTIGPGALPGDTTVGLVPVDASDADDQNIAAARMEPEGLVLDSPVVVSFPLPSSWTAADVPLVLEFKGDDPRDAVPTAAYARVTGAAGNYRAEVLVSHFSGVVCAKNCHAGTIRHVLQQFTARGCDADSVLSRVRAAYPGVVIPADGCGARGVETVQAFLDTYFDDIGGYNDGQDVPGNILSQLTTYAMQGRQVVLAFKSGTWGSRGGTHNFYPASEMDYAHTAALEVKDGQAQLRNSLATQNQRLIAALGGSNTVWYPASQLNAFRRLPQGVAAELQVCGAPDCMTDSTKNAHGVDAFHPVAGVSYVGRAWSDPWGYLLSQGPWSGIQPRGVPWTAVRVYVQKATSPLDQLCSEESGANTLTATVSFPGYYSATFAPVAVVAGLGSYNEEPGYPVIQAFGGPLSDPYVMFTADFMMLGLGKSFSTGIYNFDVLTLPLLAWSSPRIKDQDSDLPTTFAAVSGTLMLEEFGVAPGSRVKGSINVALEGDRAIFVGEDIEFVTITGTASGTFDVILSGSTSGAIARRSATHDRVDR